MLAAMVAKGELPPVEERLPDDPAVRETIESIGNYGGTIKVLATAINAYQDMQLAVEGANMYQIPMSGIGLEPNLAKGYEVSEDKKAFTVYLREGTKWSDGHPFTTEDVRFFYEDMQNYPDRLVRTWGVTRSIEIVEVIDDYAIKLINPAGHGGFLITAAGWDSGWVASYMPAHYLKKWHIDYNADAQKEAQEAGFENWYNAMTQQYGWFPPNKEIVDLPRTTAWVWSARGTSAIEMTRNPYYWAVDEEGNQLPYIDKIFSTIVDQEVYQLKIIGGDVDIAYKGTQIPNIALYRANEAAGDYRTILWPSNSSSDFTIELNLFNPDPIMKEIEGDIRFRQALSSAINREEMNELLYYGLAVPRQLAPLPSVSYYKEEWGNYYADYDPVLANKLLDEMGLNKKGSDGFRLRSDGKPVQMVIEFSNPNATTGFELIKEYWEAIGVKTIVKVEDAGLIEQRMFASLHDAIHDGFNQGGDERTLYGMTWHWDSQATRQWDLWRGSMERAWDDQVGDAEIPVDYLRRMPEDTSNLEGIQPPEFYIDYLEARASFTDYPIGSPEYAKVGQEIFGTFVENLWNIGMVGMAPTPLIVKNNVGNIPDPNNYIKGQRLADPLVSHFADVLYFK